MLIDDEITKTIAQNEEKKRMREVADDFRRLIAIKQAEYEEYGVDYYPETLIDRTPYEDRVQILYSVISTRGPGISYVWNYTERCGNRPAILTEKKGF